MLRRSEWVLIAYFTYCIACSQIMPVRAGVPFVTMVLNSAIIGGLVFLAYAENIRHRPMLTVMRDWYPLPLMLLAYREMGWFAPPSHSFDLEHAWIRYDRLLLHDWGLRRVIESTGSIGPSILEIAYSLVYAIAPFCMTWLYARRLPERMDAFLTTFLTSIFLSYFLFPFFPSEPPRTVFPDQDLPGVLTIFRRFNLGLVGNYGIHTSVFPSAHCSGAFGAAFAIREVLPEQPGIWRGLVVLAILIATATVYGRYHYLVDALAGIAIALVAWGVARYTAPRKSDLK